MPRRTLIPLCAVLGIAVALAAPGCGYHVGSMHPDNVRTVYVPIFRSEEFRRDLEFALTEAVIKEIERSSPYKVVQAGQADTELIGTVTALKKSVSTINPDSDPRELGVTLTVNVSWRDRRTGQLLVKGGAAGQTRELSETVLYRPELGESITSATNRAVNRMAKRIVELMEVPW